MKEIENEKIFDLLSQKSYEELTDTEKTLVAKELSMSEYKAYREVVFGFKVMDDAIEVKESEQRVKKQVWWQYRIPTYQVAAVLVVAMVSTFVFTKNSLQHSPELSGTNYVELDTLASLKKSVNMIKEEYPTSFVINW